MDIAKAISQYWYEASEAERIEWLKVYGLDVELAELELVDMFQEIPWQLRRYIEQDLAEHIM
jgi:hypothetical protein